jgi:hypothetical protein
MPDYTYDNLDAGIAELQRRAIWVALKQALIGPNENTGTTPRSSEEQAAASKIEAYFSHVPGLFEPFQSMPESGNFREVSSHLGSVADFLCTTQASHSAAFDLPTAPQVAFAGISSASSTLEQWNGSAAREFKVNYLDPLPFQLLGQYNLIGAAAKLMEEEAKIWDQARLDVAQILNKGIDAINALEKSCDSHTWAVVLTAVVSLATIAAVPIAGAGLATAELTLAATDAGASFATVVLPSDNEKKRIAFKGATPDQVIAEVGQALQALADTITGQEARIAGVLQSATTMLDGDTRKLFVPGRPLAAGTTKTNFGDDQHFGTAS